MKKIITVGIALFLVLAVALFGIRSLRHRSRQNTVLGSQNTNTSETSATSTPIVESSGNIPLTITSPSDNQTVSTGSVTVTGVTSPGAEVSVNEMDTTADSNGKFSATVNLDEGSNPIVIVANDSNGNFIEKDLNITYTPGQ